MEFGYDCIMLAAGVRQSYAGHDEDPLRIRRRIFGAFEMAESADDPAERLRT